MKNIVNCCPPEPPDQICNAC